MSDSGDIPQLDELEPLEEPAADPNAVTTPAEAVPPATAEAPPGAGAPPSIAERTLGVLSSGLPAPASNPRAEKEYYRFLAAGVVMFIGCMMPFGPEWSMAGYKTLGGALFTVISLGMIWSWWGAIHRNRFAGANLKWVLLALVPFFLILIDLMRAFQQPAVVDYVAQNLSVSSWSEVAGGFLGMITGSEDGARVGNFFRAFGTGKIVLFLGTLLAELSFLMAIFGGAKAAKKQKKARATGGGGRRARR